MINYYLLIKPGIILGNLITFTAGFVLASKGSFDFKLFALTLLGLALIIASACVFNNYIDRNTDQLMSRTKNRALATGSISGFRALSYGTALGIIGNGILLTSSHPLTAGIANAGLVIYVCLYTPLKSRSALSTFIGSIAGAVPPIVGYTAVSNRVDLQAVLLFFTLLFWQMPHFYSIGIRHQDDYSKANLPILPISKGVFRTKVHSVIYILLLIPTISFLTFSGSTGQLFLFITLVIALSWLALSIRGFKAKDDIKWGRQMFRTSLVMINAVCLLIFFDKA